ncbi:AfsR/SARP family transcriptional regulator [Streptomyces sp. MNU103]|nr:AfsR/SARP family transcriptional regulator [Streptomyces sp. MNU103]
MHRFQDALARARRTPGEVAALGEALAAWRGPAYADVTGSAWADRERARLEELREEAVELRARLLLDRGDGAGLVSDLRDHVAAHPWREPAWTLLARALHHAGRRADALDTLRRARVTLADQLGLDPGAELLRLETDLLNGAPRPPPRPPPGPAPASCSARAPPWTWPAPSPWRAATRWSAPAATASPRSRRRNAPATSPSPPGSSARTTCPPCGAGPTTPRSPGRSSRPPSAPSPRSAPAPPPI